MGRGAHLMSLRSESSISDLKTSKDARAALTTVSSLPKTSMSSMIFMCQTKYSLIKNGHHFSSPPVEHAPSHAR